MIRKKILFKFITVFSLSIQPLMAATSQTQNPYSAFDERIYDQTTLFSTRPNFECLNDESYQRAVLRHFTYKKIRQLEENLFSIYDKELEYLNYLSEKYKPSIASKVMGGAGQFLAAAAGLGILAIPGVGEEVAAMRIFMAVGAAAGAVGAGMSIAQEFLKPDGNFDIDKLKTAILQKKTTHILNINKEPGIFDLEIEYVLKKPFMENEDLQKNVEEILIAMRKGGITATESYREYIGNFLKLPLRKKRVSVESSLLDIQTKIPNDFEHLNASQRAAAEELLNYEIGVKREISRLLLQIKYSSYSDSLSQRKFYYFFGDPGIGKTTAAKNIAQLLQLPLFTQSIRTGADLSEVALEGQNWQWPGANTGFLARTLGTNINDGIQSTDKRTIIMPFQEITRYGLSPVLSIDVPIHILSNTYWNAILLINDFDRILMDSSTTTQTLSFFLDYLDPCKKNFYSPYFKARIPIEDLVIIVTGNYPIPSLTERDSETLKEGVDIYDPAHAALKYRMQFQALKDRLVEIHFKTLERSGKADSLSKFMDEMCRKYHLNLSGERKGAILESVMQFPSVRDAKKRIEQEILDHKITVVEDALPLLQQGHRPAAIFSISDTAQADLSSYSYLTLPHLDEIDLQKELKSLEIANEYIKFLLSSVQAKQYEGIKRLFGEKGKILNTYASIQAFWKTSVVRSRKFRENAGGIQALANRLARFKCPQSQEKLVRFHIQAAQVLLHSLLQRAGDRDKFIWDELVINNHRKANLQLFLTHLGNLSDLQRELDQLTHSEVKFGAEMEGFLGESSRIINAGKQELESFINPALDEGESHLPMTELNPLIQKRGGTRFSRTAVLDV